MSIPLNNAATNATAIEMINEFFKLEWVRFCGSLDSRVQAAARPRRDASGNVQPSSATPENPSSNLSPDLTWSRIWRAWLGMVQPPHGKELRMPKHDGGRHA